MRKRKLLTAALTAAMTVAGGGIASAEVTQGVSVTAGDNYFLYNVGAGKYLTNGLNWGTRASVDNAGRVIKLTANGSGYTVHTQNYSSPMTKPGYLTTNGYVDTPASDCNWVFEPVAVDGYTNTYRVKVADNPKDEKGNDNNGKYLTFVPSTAAVDPTSKDDGNNSVWILVPLTQRQTDGDYTYLLQNTDFNCRWEQKFWTGAEYTYKYKSNNEEKSHTVGVTGGKDNNYVHEYYTMETSRGEFDTYQTITMPVGIYKLSCQGFYRGKNSDSQEAILYINNGKSTNSVPLKTLYSEGKTAADNDNGFSVSKNNVYVPDSQGDASLALSAGYYPNSILLEVPDGAKVVVGVKKTTKTAGEWTVIDNFTLQKASESEQKTYMDEKISKAKEITLNENTTKINKTLTDAITEAENANYENDGYAKATVNLVDAVNNYDTAVKAYNNLKVSIPKCKVLQGLNAGSSDFADYYAKAENAFENETSADTLSKYSNNLVNNYRVYLRKIAENYKTATVHIKNATVANTKKAGDAYANSSDKGWTFTTNPQNKGVSASLNSIDHTGIFMENWRDNNNGGLNGNISQTIQNLPTGKYFLKMTAHTRNAGENDYIYIKSADNEEKGAILLAGTPSITMTAPMEINDGTAEVGLHVEGSDWAVWNVVELYAYSIDDQTRNVTTGMYGTICLPYNATVTGATLYEATVDATNNVVNLTEATGNIEQGKAYIYQATADTQTFKYVDDTNLIKDAATGSALTGVFTQTEVPVGAYVMQKHDDADVQKFYKVAGEGISLNAYRAYLNAPATANAKAMNINLNGATGIDAINALTEGNAVIYDLNGNRLNKLQHGINIVNGVKVVVK